MDAVFSIAFTGVGALFGAIGIFLLVRSWQSRSWPQAIGTVVSSKVEQYYDRGTLMFRPEVTYRYSVSGHEYVSSQRVLGGEGGTNWPAPAEEVVGRYPTGANVSLRYDARNPATAVLEPAQYRGPLVFTGIGSLLLLLGLWMW